MSMFPHGPQARSIRGMWPLKEWGVPLKVASYSFETSKRQLEFPSLSSAGRVPVLEVKGEWMFESDAMMEYLCEKTPERGWAVSHGIKAVWHGWSDCILHRWTCSRTLRSGAKGVSNGRVSG